jgi:hypothetical protein
VAAALQREHLNAIAVSAITFTRAFDFDLSSAVHDLFVAAVTPRGRGLRGLLRRVCVWEFGDVLQVGFSFRVAAGFIYREWALKIGK